MLLERNKDYGFTQLKITDTAGLPVWDKFRLQKIREIFITSKIILDFGDSSRALSDLFSLKLKDKKRITVDINGTLGPDVTADICNLKMFDNKSIDGIICASMLEHVYNPFIAVSELFRVLRQVGKCLYMSHGFSVTTRLRQIFSGIPGMESVTFLGIFRIWNCPLFADILKLSSI